MSKLNKTFKINPLYESDSYKTAHKQMLASGITRLYGTWIPRKMNYMPNGIDQIMSAGQQLVWRYIHSNFQEYFFDQPINIASDFVDDISKHLGMPYDGNHFIELHKLGYLPIRVKSLPEGIFTNNNIPHMTFINTVDEYAWLTLFLETMISKLAWRLPTAATIAKRYREVATEWVTLTDVDNLFLLDYMCHDFSSRGGSPFDSIAVGLAHALSFKGSDTLNVIPASRYYYDVPNDEVVINSVAASEHSVSTTKIFTVGEKQMIIDWCKEFPIGILSIVADTFSLWEFIEYLKDPEVNAAVLARDGKLVVRPDSGDPVDITCGVQNAPYKGAKSYNSYEEYEIETMRIYKKAYPINEYKGVVELLWDIFGGTVNKQGYKVLSPFIGTIYGDSINLNRQLEIYQRLEAKGFATTNITLGVGSFQYIGSITRDSAGYAAKGSWFEVLPEYNPCTNVRDGYSCEKHNYPIGEARYNGNNKECIELRNSYNIYKDPITDDGTKKSLKGLVKVEFCDSPQCSTPQYIVLEECTWEEESQGLLQTIYEDGKFYNSTTFNEIREKILNK